MASMSETPQPGSRVHARGASPAFAVRCRAPGDAGAFFDVPAGGGFRYSLLPGAWRQAFAAPRPFRKGRKTRGGHVQR